MKITLVSEDAIRLTGGPGPLTVEAQSAEQAYSPFHMLASSLATCTYSVLHSWAEHADLEADDLAIDVSWEFADDPHRVSRILLGFEWPSLPTERRNAAERAAALCTVHHTLLNPPEVGIEARL